MQRSTKEENKKEKQCNQNYAKEMYLPEKPYSSSERQEIDMLLAPLARLAGLLLTVKMEKFQLT
jgi:hypothetical protein